MIQFTTLLHSLAQATATSGDGPAASFALTAAMVVGFIAAVSIGSIAWYNSKRPTGWEDKQRPDIVPDIDK